MRIAFFTALKEERVALRAAWPLEDSGTIQGLSLDSGERAMAFCSGMGEERMARAVERGVSLFKPDLAVLLGFSAGLRDGLQVGEVVCDDRGDPDLVQALRDFPLPLRFGQVVSGGLLRDEGDKRALASRCPEALAADMESGAFLRAVGSIPHLVLRVISDDVTAPMPLPFDQLLTEQGFPDERKIVKQLAVKPGLLPGVLRLARTSGAAQRALRQTVVDVRPLLVRRLLEMTL